MKPSRPYCAAMMTFWMFFLAMLAMVFTYAPRGGVTMAGFDLFVRSSLVDGTLAAMGSVGISADAQAILFGLLGGLYLAASGLVLFAMLFSVFGEEAEQRDALPLAEGAAVCVAVASAVALGIGLAGGEAGALMFLQVVALGGLVLIVLSVAQTGIGTGADQPEPSVDIDNVIADHAAANAVFSARLASLTRREVRS